MHVYGQSNASFLTESTISKTMSTNDTQDGSKNKQARGYKSRRSTKKLLSLPSKKESRPYDVSYLHQEIKQVKDDAEKYIQKETAFDCNQKQMFLNSSQIINNPKWLSLSELKRTRYNYLNYPKRRGHVGYLHQDLGYDIRVEYTWEKGLKMCSETPVSQGRETELSVQEKHLLSTRKSGAYKPYHSYVIGPERKELNKKISDLVELFQPETSQLPQDAEAKLGRIMNNCKTLRLLKEIDFDRALDRQEIAETLVRGIMRLIPTISSGEINQILGNYKKDNALTIEEGMIERIAQWRVTSKNEKKENCVSDCPGILSLFHLLFGQSLEENCVLAVTNLLRRLITLNEQKLSNDELLNTLKQDHFSKDKEISQKIDNLLDALIGKEREFQLKGAAKKEMQSMCLDDQYWGKSELLPKTKKLISYTQSESELSSELLKLYMMANIHNEKYDTLFQLVDGLKDYNTKDVLIFDALDTLRKDPDFKGVSNTDLLKSLGNISGKKHVDVLTDVLFRLSFQNYRYMDTFFDALLIRSSQTLNSKESANIERLMDLMFDKGFEEAGNHEFSSRDHIMQLLVLNNINRLDKSKINRLNLVRDESHGKWKTGNIMCFTSPERYEKEAEVKQFYEFALGEKVSLEKRLMRKNLSSKTPALKEAIDKSLDKILCDLEGKLGDRSKKRSLSSISTIDTERSFVIKTDIYDNKLSEISEENVDFSNSILSEHYENDLVSRGSLNSFEMN